METVKFKYDNNEYLNERVKGFVKEKKVDYICIVTKKIKGISKKIENIDKDEDLDEYVGSDKDAIEIIKNEKLKLKNFYKEQTIGILYIKEDENEKYVGSDQDEKLLIKKSIEDNDSLVVFKEFNDIQKIIDKLSNLGCYGLIREYVCGFKYNNGFLFIYINKSEFDTQFESEFDYKENQFLNEKVKEFVKEKKVDYVCYETGYTERISIKNMKEIDAIYRKDENGKYVGSDKDEKLLIKKFHNDNDLDGTIVFKGFGDVQKTVDTLEKLDYCACLNLVIIMDF